eukprot:CAMPEP_0180559590 /NCGR_PEP_ID=MMETSP1037_2-20121125/2378_1 /TAXON_ID=632150 /ORGANISM="Azadinium spinosum, Strain 3D9" /LENGTH=264 /DNA_ID=CAMNT_0022576073 /DNA_START=14 /DNA_END=808 /DNA_ORIENTATION=-
MYVFSITITRGALEFLVENGAEAGSAIQTMFGSLHLTIYTLAKAMLQGQDWGEISDALFELSPVFPLFFFVYLAFSILAMANIITGVFCDNVREVAKTERGFIASKEVEIKERYINEMQELFNEIDHDRSGNLNWDEFETFFEDQRVQCYFKAIGIDASDVERLWRLLDMDMSGEIGIDEFLTGCLKFKGPAMSVDTYSIMQECKRLSKTMSTMESLMHRIARSINMCYANAVASGKADLLVSTLYTWLLMGRCRPVSLGAVAI